MRHLVTNLSKKVSESALHAAMGERLDRLSPGNEREQHFGSIVGEVAHALDLRAIVEFRAGSTWATFTDEADQPAVSFALAEEANR